MNKNELSTGDRVEIFVDAYLLGNRQIKAYAKSHPERTKESNGALRVAASRYFKSQRIQKRLKEARAEIEKSSFICQGIIIERLLAYSDKCLKSDSPTAGVTALVQISRILGYDRLISNDEVAHQELLDHLARFSSSLRAAQLDSKEKHEHH